MSSSDSDDGVCDLSCANDDACAALGSEFQCIEQRCRASVAEPDPVVVSLVPSDSGETMLLSSVDVQAAPPKARWLGDRWAVAWMSYSSPITLQVRDVLDTGIGSAHEVVFNDLLFSRAVLALSDHQVVVTEARGLCGLSIVDWSSADVQDVFVPCSDQVAVANVPGTDEWIMATMQGDEVSAGRYNVGDGWLSPLMVVGEHPATNALAASARANAATLVLGSDEGGSVFRFDDIDDMADATMSSFAGRVEADGSYGLAQLSDRTVVVGSRGGHLWKSVLGAGLPPSILEIADTGVIDRPFGIAVIPERNLIAVCYSTGPGPGGGAVGSMDGVAAILLDQTGTPASAPFEVATDIWNGGGCDLAWSGDELLVVWGDIDQMVEPNVSVIRARRLAIAE